MYLHFSRPKSIAIKILKLGQLTTNKRFAPAAINSSIVITILNNVPNFNKNHIYINRSHSFYKLACAVVTITQKQLSIPSGNELVG